MQSFHWMFYTHIHTHTRLDAKSHDSKCFNTWYSHCSLAKQGLLHDDTGSNNEEDEVEEAKEETTRSCLYSGFVHHWKVKRERIFCSDNFRCLFWHISSSYRLIQNLIFENDPRLVVLKKEIKINARSFLFKCNVTLKCRLNLHKGGYSSCETRAG